MARSPARPRSEPRLSATQLADYLAAPSQLAQMGILRNAKYPGEAKPLIIQYQHARRCISACLITPESRNQIAAAAILDLEQRRDDPANRPLVRDDARRSIEVIQTFQGSVNALELYGLRFAAPAANSPPLRINGVEISVYPDAISIGSHRDGDRIGQLFVRCAIGGAGEAAENRRVDANLHLATIAYMHSVENLAHLGTPHPPASIVVDVMRERTLRGPTSSTLRVRNIETACTMIAAIWAKL